MLSPSKFRSLVSGRERGSTASLWRCALRLAEVPYAAAVGWRNRCYDRGLIATRRVPVPVVSVGNLTLGGTGKTPMVEWITRWFASRGVRVTVISRGYGARPGAPNDEALELQRKLPDVIHLQNPDRVQAARAAVEQFGCQLIVLDDAFQHRRIGRDLDIVMLDALEPFGFGHVFPRGTLREPVAGLRRAQVVVLSRSDMLQPSQRDEIRRQAQQYAAGAVWVEVAHTPRILLSASGSTAALESIRGQPVAAFCGIGNPRGFQHTLQTCAYKVAAFREFPDHHRYSRADMHSLVDWASRLEVAAVLCTQKDLVKLGSCRFGPRPVWAVAIGLECLAGQNELEASLTALLPQQPAINPLEDGGAGTQSGGLPQPPAISP